MRLLLSVLPSLGLSFLGVDILFLACLRLCKVCVFMRHGVPSLGRTGERPGNHTSQHLLRPHMPLLAGGV